MGRVEIRAKIASRSAAEIFEAFADYGRWPEYSESILEVFTCEVGGRRESSWKAKFHDGELHWTEVDHLDPHAGRGSFTQIEGDIETFDGEWELSDDLAGCRIRFTAAFDLGLPSLRDLLEPIAEQAIRENIQSVLLGLAGEDVTFDPPCPDGRADAIDARTGAATLPTGFTTNAPKTR
jgi:hypothetical protein